MRVMSRWHSLLFLFALAPMGAMANPAQIDWVPLTGFSILNICSFVNGINSTFLLFIGSSIALSPAIHNGIVDSVAFIYKRTLTRFKGRLVLCHALIKRRPALSYPLRFLLVVGGNGLKVVAHIGQ